MARKLKITDDRKIRASDVSIVCFLLLQTWKFIFLLPPIHAIIKRVIIRIAFVKEAPVL